MFKKFLCAVALASLAFAQDLNLVLPEGLTLKANSDVNILLSSNADISQDLGVVVAASGCFGDCPSSSSGLGNVIYSGAFEDNQNITVRAPNWFNGDGVLNVAHFYTSGIRNVAKFDIASAKITVTGSSG